MNQHWILLLSLFPNHAQMPRNKNNKSYLRDKHKEGMGNLYVPFHATASNATSIRVM